MALSVKLPDKEDLPVTEGPPQQDEPDGQQLGGPHPDEVTEDHKLLAHNNQRELLKPLQSLKPEELGVLRTITPQVSGDAVVQALVNLLGDAESPDGSNCNAVTHRCGVGCVAWCDENWWTALFNAGFNSGGHVLVPGVATDYWFGDAYVPSTQHHFQAAGRFDAKPLPGAGEIHYWSNPTTNPGDSHIAGYIKDYGDGTHLNVEGNHSNRCEYVRRPNNDSTRAGYCLPVYSANPQPVPQEDDMRLFIQLQEDNGQVHPAVLEVHGRCLEWVPSQGHFDFLKSMGPWTLQLKRRGDGIWGLPVLESKGAGLVGDAVLMSRDDFFAGHP